MKNLKKVFVLILFLSCETKFGVANLKIWAQCYKTFLSVIYEFLYYARVFVPKTFQA
jgi:hypothetical protein